MIKHNEEWLRGGGPRTIVKSWAIGWFFFPHSHKVPVKGDSTSRGNAKHHTTRDTGGISLQFPRTHFSSFVSFVRFGLLVKTNHGCFVGVNNVLTTPQVAWSTNCTCPSQRFRHFSSSDRIRTAHI